VRIHLKQATERITPYDVTDMERFISVQTKALNDTYAQNALLVSSNSELRMFLSFMPIRYREYVSELRAESNILYRQQRISPKVIQTNDRGTEIQLVDAPISDPTVQYALRSAEYATLGAVRSHIERGVVLRKRILSDPSTRVLLKHAPPGDQPPPPFLHTTAANRYAPTSANARKKARTKIVHDRQPTELVTDIEDQQDDHDDQPPPVSQLHPRVRAYIQRTQGQEEYVPPSHQGGGKEEYVPPSYKGKGYKRKHGPPPMANMHQPPPKFSKYDNPAASQRVLELARGDKTARPPKPLPQTRQVVGDPQPAPADLTRGQGAGIPPITANPIRLFTRQKAINEYDLIAPSALPPSGQCLPFEDMERLLRKYMPVNSNEAIEIPEYGQDMATYMVERLHQAYSLPDKFIYEHMHVTSRYSI
jgi:hypothetical protein